MWPHHQLSGNNISGHRPYRKTWEYKLNKNLEMFRKLISIWHAAYKAFHSGSVKSSLAHFSSILTVWLLVKPKFYLGPFYRSTVFHLHTYVRTKSKAEVPDTRGGKGVSLLDQSIFIGKTSMFLKTPSGLVGLALDWALGIWVLVCFVISRGSRF